MNSAPRSFDAIFNPNQPTYYLAELAQRIKDACAHGESAGIHASTSTEAPAPIQTATAVLSPPAIAPTVNNEGNTSAQHEGDNEGDASVEVVRDDEGDASGDDEIDLHDFICDDESDASELCDAESVASELDGGDASDEISDSEEGRALSDQVDDGNETNTSDVGEAHLQEGWLRQVERYYGSVIQESVPRYLPGCGDQPGDPVPPFVRTANFKSKAPTYYTAPIDKQTDAQIQETAVKRTLDEQALASTVQTHQCNECCTKYGTIKCRFNFPRPIVLATIFKDGTVINKRLDTHCNNYNRAMLSVLRSNQDIKMLSTGVDSKATIFYITDYVTKSELSQYQTVTLLKVAIDKIEKNNAEYGPKKLLTSLDVAQNRGRQRIYTFLNVLDTDVERSGQWVTLILMGYPLEYKSNSFKSLSAGTRHTQILKITS